jgi:hypothetical protein
MIGRTGMNRDKNWLRFAPSRSAVASGRVEVYEGLITEWLLSFLYPPHRAMWSNAWFCEGPYCPWGLLQRARLRLRVAALDISFLISLLIFSPFLMPRPKAELFAAGALYAKSQAGGG